LLFPQQEPPFQLNTFILYDADLQLIVKSGMWMVKHHHLITFADSTGEASAIRRQINNVVPKIAREDREDLEQSLKHG
jgi:hypothetical protein